MHEAAAEAVVLLVATKYKETSLGNLNMYCAFRRILIGPMQRRENGNREAYVRARRFIPFSAHRAPLADWDEDSVICYRMWIVAAGQYFSIIQSTYGLRFRTDAIPMPLLRLLPLLLNAADANKYKRKRRVLSRRMTCIRGISRVPARPGSSHPTALPSVFRLNVRIVEGGNTSGLHSPCRRLIASKTAADNKETSCSSVRGRDATSRTRNELSRG